MRQLVIHKPCGIIENMIQHGLIPKSATYPITLTVTENKIHTDCFILVGGDSFLYSQSIDLE